MHIFKTKNSNMPPVAIAGENQIVREEKSGILDGTLSWSSLGDSLAFEWISDPLISIENDTLVKTVFTAPKVYDDTIFTVMLKATAPSMKFAYDTLQITVQNNLAPVAIATADLSQSTKGVTSFGFSDSKIKYIFPNSTISLNGSDSYDPENDSLAFKWSAPQEFTLSSVTEKSPTFTAPANSKDKVLIENNCDTIYWKTGHSHIKRKVNTEKALAGFEKSGHFFFNQPLGYGYDDGINSAIQVCHLLNNQNKKMSEIINELPVTYQSPTMAPFCKDEEKYQVVEELVKQVEEIKTNQTKIDEQAITEVLTVNGVRFSFEDGSWGLIRASSNKPSLVVVTESPSSDKRKKKIFDFIDNLLQKTGKIGDYDQKI